MKQKSPRPLRQPTEVRRRSRSAYRNSKGGRVGKGRSVFRGSGLSKHAQRNWRRTHPETGQVYGDRVPNRVAYAVQWSTTKPLPWQTRKKRRAADKWARASRKGNR